MGVLFVGSVEAFVLNSPLTKVPVDNRLDCSSSKVPAKRLKGLYPLLMYRDSSDVLAVRPLNHVGVWVQNCFHSLARTIVSTTLLYLVTFHSLPAFSQDTSGSQHQWNFGEDRVVQVKTPLVLSRMSLDRPTLLGAGGGGAVLQMQRIHDQSPVAVKISWLASANSVSNECMILKQLEKEHVHGVERCLAMDSYPLDPRRVMIALEPVFVDSANSLMDVKNQEAQAKATRQLVRTLVEMLAARVVATDVQLLVSQTGEVLLVDLTEAKALSLDPSPMDMALVASFCSEILSQVPESMYRVADAALTEFLVSCKVDDDLYNVLAWQRDVLVP